MPKILVVHELTMPLGQLFQYEKDWTVTVKTYEDMLEALKAGEYDGLIMDCVCPPEFDGQGLFENITWGESRDGAVMVFVLALRLREAFPDLPMAIIGDAGIPGGLYGRKLLIQCTGEDVLFAEIASAKDVVKHINRLIARNAKAKELGIEL